MFHDGQRRKWDRQNHESHVEALKWTEDRVSEAHAKVARLRQEKPGSMELLIAESDVRALQMSLDVSRVMGTGRRT